MLFRKSVVVLAVFVLLMSVIAGCSKQSSQSSGTSGTQTTQATKGEIWMIPSHRAHPVWMVGKAGFEKACKEMGYKARWEAADDGQSEKNIEYMEQAIIEKPAGILILPANESYNQIIDKATDAGIPVVTIHMDAPDSKRKAYIGPNQQVYAEACADRIGELLKGKGNVLAVQGSSYQIENKVRAFFEARIKAKFPNINLYKYELEGTEPVKAIKKDEEIIQKYPDLDAVFSSTGGGAVSWSKAMEETGTEGKFIVISMDVTKQNLDLVRDGKVYAVIGQGIYDEGYNGVKLILDKNAKAINYTETPIITKDMVDKYYDQTGGK